MVQSFAEIENQVLIDNTAQSVLKHLKEQENNRAHVITRWVWEILQNARDASVNSDGKLIASIVQNENEIVFRHNGGNFKMEEIAHLIYHGSTKVETKETIGRYGSGFLTTHLLSPEIEVSGRLDDNRNFKFRLKRELGSVKELSDSMRSAAEAFERSLSNSPANDSFTTEFRYHPLRDDAFDVVSEGIAKLKQCASLVVAFNSQFATIKIETPNGIVEFNEIDRKDPQQSGIEQITVSETADGNKKVRQYLVSHGNKLSVAIPMESTDDGKECLQVENTPRLFLGFPLIGTENFSFPAIINSSRFTLTESRDGVYLWQNRDNANGANQKNQEVLEEACGLLVDMLQFVALSGWSNAYRLAEIPNILPQKCVNEDKLRDFLKEFLIEKIRQTPAVHNESGKAMPPKESEIPIANTPEGVLSLWDLLVEWRKDGDIWPRRDEAPGWCDAVRSWARLSEYEPLTFDEAIDGRKLASIVDDVSRDPAADPRTHRVSRLANSLKGNIPAINWLDQLISFLRDNGQADVVSEYRIVPSQAGFLHKLLELHHDVGISEELKTVAGLLEWRIKIDLRDTRIAALTEEPGRGDWDNDYVAGELIRRLQDRAEKTPDAAFAEASVRLFTWIVKQQKWDLLRGFPVFSNETSAQRRVIKLERDADDALRRPLAPVSAWPPKLQDFDKLFPSRYTLANAFSDSEAVSDPKVWEVLEADGFVRRNVIITKKVCLNFETFLPDEPLTDGDHKTSKDVSITDVAFINKDDIGIMARVRQSQRLARLFWRFLTEWMTKHDLGGLEISKADCDCSKTHRYYPAEWLIPVSGNKWVPFSAEGSRGARKADAQSLANLLRGSGWTPASLDDSPATVKLLEAIGVTQFDLTRSFMASTDEERAEQEKEFTRILTSTDGDLKPVTKILASTGGDLEPVIEFAEDLKHDSKLLEHLAERRERRRVVHGNQRLGAHVEKLVKEVLEKYLEEGFTVRNTGVGSDLAIEEYDLATLEINKSGRRWLVEVKATRGQEVRMTATQAKTAVQKGKRFFLCVVPVSGEIDVKNSMRFVQNIGRLKRLKQLCNDLDGFKKLRGDITADSSQGIQLKVEDGAAWVRIASSVWQNEGFPLDELPDHLN